jgi:hypothetical protein
MVRVFTPLLVGVLFSLRSPEGRHRLLHPWLLAPFPRRRCDRLPEPQRVQEETKAVVMVLVRDQPEPAISVANGQG